MGFDWTVSVSVAFSQPIALPPNVSYWYLLKKLANYEGARDHKRPRSPSSGLVTRGRGGRAQPVAPAGIHAKSRGSGDQPSVAENRRVNIENLLFAVFFAS